MPLSMATNGGKYCRELFNSAGDLRRVPMPPRITITERLTKEYGMNLETAKFLESFLIPMLQFVPSDRASARRCLQHPWMRESETVSMGLVIDMTHPVEGEEQTKSKKQVEDKDNDADDDSP